MLKRVVRTVLLFLCAFTSFSVHAQSSRNEEIAQQKAEKAKNLRPYKIGRAEEIVISLTGPRNGFYPVIGSAFSGGGFSLGPGYFKMLGENMATDIHGLWSIENYKMIQGSVRKPLLDGKMSVFTNAKYVDAGHVSFFGIGNDTEDSDKTNYEYRPATIGAGADLSLVNRVTAGGGVEYLHVETNPGNSSSSPSIEQEFNEITAPGLNASPSYTVTNLHAAFDWRQSPGYTTSGGYYRVDWWDYNDLGDSNAFSFRRVDVELDQYIPILRANQILAFRGLFSFTDTEEGSEIPHYLLPKLGGGSELRGFRSHRFRDLNRMLLTAEYRWTASKFLDMDIFYEVGKVAADRKDLDFEDLHTSVGIGGRFHGPGFTVLRIELAHSKESTRIIFDTGLLF